MQPKSARKSTGPRGKAAARTAKSAPSKAAEMKGEKLEESWAKESAVNGSVDAAEAKEDTKKEELKEDKPAENPSPVTDLTVNEVKREEGAKGTGEDEYKEEQLQLEEYDPEEDATAVDYDFEQDLPSDDPHRDEDDEIQVDGEELEEELEEELVEEELEESEESEEELGLEQEQQELVKEHRKRKEFEIFVGGLDKDATESDLRRVFGELGQLTEVRLMVNPITKKNKGFAFLRYATVEQAKRVISEMKNPVIRGKQCGIAPSHDNDTLFVGNVCKTWTKEHLKETLKGYGVENFEELKLVEDSHNEGMNRGFAFLEFSCRDEAMDALKRLQRRDVNLGSDRPPKVAFSDSFKEPDDEIMALVKTVFVDCLPPAWDEDRVRKYLKKYGSIEKIELARNMPSAKRKDFGFVTFDTHDNAVACAKGINDSELGEGDKKVKVRARLSRPNRKDCRPRHTSLRSSSYKPGPRPSRMDRACAPYIRPPPPLVRTSRLPLRTSPRVTSSSSRSRGGIGPISISSSGRGLKRSVVITDRRTLISMPERMRAPPARRPAPPQPLPPPRRAPPPSAYPKSSSKRDREYSSRHDDHLPPPSRRAPLEDYPLPPPRAPHGSRHSSYSEDYPPPSRGGYSDIAPRSAPSRPSDRRAFLEDGYGRKESGPRPGRDYDSVYGTKRPYSDIDDGPRHGEIARNSRARLDYDDSHYTDSYSDRLGRTHVGYGGGSSGRTSLSSHGGFYGSRHGMGYAGGSARGSDVGGVYSSGLSGGYLSRGSDGGGGSSYPSLYSSRNLGGGSGSYY